VATPIRAEKHLRRHNVVDTSVSVQTDYNYVHFGEPGRMEDPNRFKQVNPVGSLAPDFPATRLRDLTEVHLSDYLGKGLVVLEFGSVT
jgi:hypothetical protein